METGTLSPLQLGKSEILWRLEVSPIYRLVGEIYFTLVVDAVHCSPENDH